VGVKSLVVVIDRHGERLLGLLLTDDVLVKRLLDVDGAFQPWLESGFRRLIRMTDGADLLAQNLYRAENAAVADEGSRPSDHAVYLLACSSAEGANNRRFRSVTFPSAVLAFTRLFVFYHLVAVVIARLLPTRSRY